MYGQLKPKPEMED